MGDREGQRDGPLPEGKGPVRGASGRARWAGQARPAMASRTIQMPVRSWTWVWMRASSPV